MCDFLTGPNHRDKRRITQLEEQLKAERHACDALFASLRNKHSSEAMNLYSRVLLARSTNNYEQIIDLSHEIIGENR
jgi:hypothetical protein